MIFRISDKFRKNNHYHIKINYYKRLNVNKRSKKTIIVYCLLLICIILLGSTYASRTIVPDQQGQVDITTRYLSVGLVGEPILFNSTIPISELMPGSSIPYSLQILNDTEDGYDLYGKVTINRFWVNSELNNTSIELYTLSGDNYVPIEQGMIINNWIVHHMDEQEVIMIYQHPLAHGEHSSTFIDRIQVSTNITNQYKQESFYIYIWVDAVQVIAADRSIPGMWGVIPTFDDTGRIINIED